MRMRFLVRTIAPSGRFFRVGRAWTAEGTVLDEGDLAPPVWAALKAEPMIHIGPAPDAAEAEVEDLRPRIRAAIAALGDDGFGQDGAPLIEAVRKALPAGGQAVTKPMVLEVWADLKAQTAGR